MRRSYDLAAVAALVLSAAFSVYSQKDYTIAAVQGSKNMSAHEREMVRLTGIVTARTRTGFYLQTPEDKVDADPATSEGIFVFTREEPGSEAAVGNLVTVTGQVQEFRPRSGAVGLPTTELSMQKGRDSIQVLGKEVELPRPVLLSVDDFKSGSLDQLERYEGMRVTAAELTVVSPTNGRVDNRNNTTVSDGVFYGVLKGLPKPFREPGYDIHDFVFLTPKEQEEFRKSYPKLRIFDGNPQRLRIESAAQLGAQPIEIQAHAELKNIIGVMHYGYRTYSILVDPTTKPVLVGGYPPRGALPAVAERQFSVASTNVENLFDDADDPDIKEEIATSAAFNDRLKKISAAIRDVMQQPDVIGVVEAENLSTLKRLAERVNADAVAAGKPNPKYEAHLVDGNDGRGIDVGFLVKSSRVKVLETKQLGKADKYKNPDTGEDNFLNDRPPLMIRAEVTDPANGTPFAFTIVVNHLKSFLGYSEPRQMANVRMKKRLQAEFLARWVQERQKADPKEKIIIVGDLNAFQFNDAIVDMVGTIKGKPSPREEVMHPSEDLVEPDMVDLVDLINADQRYSYRFDGNAQVLDHIIISEALRPYLHGFGYARVNADFPESLRADATRPERYSDHDAPVAYFNFEPRAAAKPAATPTPTPKP